MPGAHEGPGHDITGPEADTGGVTSLDANHDGVVTMSEMVPPRPEDGHDLIHAAVAEGALAGALILVAAYAGMRRIMGQRRSGAESGPADGEI